MPQRFAIGDRVIVTNAQVSRVPRRNVGTVVRIFECSPEICEVQFDTYSGPKIIPVDALDLAPSPDVPTPPIA